MSIPDILKVASEKTTTATAMPFCTLNDMNIFSFNVKSMPLNENIMEKNLISRYSTNKNTDFMKKSRLNGIATMMPISTKTRISKEFEKIKANSCN